MRQLLFLALIFQISCGTAFAQADSSSFLIRVFGGDDIVAPTTPVLTSATAVSFDQVDVSWTASTDNYVVSGYVVHRNGVPLATTTLTSYSDTGVVASTTYSYFVTAFDPSFNYSSSSNTLLVTTPDPPVPPATPEGDTNGGTSARVVLNDLTIIPDVTSAKLSLSTARPARFSIRWGRTNSYELGYTVNDSFVRSYTSTLTGLQPGTRYQYEVIGYTPLGNSTVLERGSFSTVNLADLLPPANVSQLRAVARGRDVALSWTPPTEEYNFVRVVRSHLRFPTYLDDGVVVYQGKESDITDRNALRDYSPAYYAVFVADDAGNISSGAVARVYYYEEGTNPAPGPEPLQPPIHNGGPLSGQPPQNASTSPLLPVGTKMPSLDEIFLQQENEQQSFATESILLDATQQFLISIPAQAISENLKTIIVSLTDPSDSRQSYSFILRLNKDNTAYEAVLSALNVEGQSRIIVDIYDYESKVVATYQKTITFSQINREVVPVFPDLLIQNSKEIFPIIMSSLAFSLLLFLLLKRRRRPLEDNG
jgi:chitodextrinase